MVAVWVCRSQSVVVPLKGLRDHRNRQARARSHLNIPMASSSETIENAMKKAEPELWKAWKMPLNNNKSPLAQRLFFFFLFWKKKTVSWQDKCKVNARRIKGNNCGLRAVENVSAYLFESVCVCAKYEIFLTLLFYLFLFNSLKSGRCSICTMQHIHNENSQRERESGKDVRYDWI